MDKSDTTSLLVPNENHKALICGLPHSVTYFTADTCRNLLSDELGDCRLIALNDLSPDTIQNVMSEEGPVLFWTDIPDQNVVDFARSSSFPILVVTTDFSTACTEYMQARDINLVDAVRTMALSKMGSWHISEIPRATTLTPGRDIALLSRHILSTLAIRKTSDEASDVIRNLDLTPYEPASSDIDNARASSNELVSQVTSALSDFYGKKYSEEAENLRIPLELFNDGLPPYARPSLNVDLVGPARCLAFGPFLYLPCGKWEVQIFFKSTQNWTHNSFAFDVFTDSTTKAKGFITIDKNGIFCFRHEFQITNPWKPVEFRSFLEKGSISGKFNLQSVSINRLN